MSPEVNVEPIPGHPRFTRRHHAVLADCLSRANASMSSDQRIGAAKVIEKLCETLSADNPKFDTARFLHDAGA